MSAHSPITAAAIPAPLSFLRPMLRDLSACCHDTRGGADRPVRLRAMRMLVAQRDPDDGTATRRLDPCPQSFAGCAIAAHYGL